ncbi:DUF1801 domain-containing protein [Rhizobium sp. TH2]|uniref:DUF1801 domain-containing protein n=1 Tax=Rhizobium sp. TH2 TaxID=2775403 RepID=UPI00215888DF|nr:DUF1801 domain-containing protein [Rhizobium sp. TH2]UVC07218.1 DUF1801 domain-containing protein [Rhizobium sp. TH2]
MTQSMPGSVEAAFQAFPPEVRHRLAEIRAMILGVAADHPRVGAITETLKWGEPAYLTKATGSGSTIRLGWPRKTPDRAAIYFICHTTLVDTFRERFGGMFEYETNRAVLLPVTGKIDRAPLEFMLSMALTYHLRSRGV